MCACVAAVALPALVACLHACRCHQHAWRHSTGPCLPIFSDFCHLLLWCLPSSAEWCVVCRLWLSDRLRTFPMTVCCGMVCGCDAQQRAARARWRARVHTEQGDLWRGQPVLWVGTGGLGPRHERPWTFEKGVFFTVLYRRVSHVSHSAVSGPWRPSRDFT